ncbi:MAG: transporter substrate-binding domain-containing protein [Culturomica sp.]|nr:transporter substrate-binding domain-containing protein [Culturomica sp.]
MEQILAKGILDISTFYSTTDYYIYQGITRGFHYELAKSFAEYLGVSLRISEVNNDIDTAIARLQEGRYDLIAVSMTQTPERDEKIRFTDPFFHTREVLVQRKEKKKVENPEDLDGKSIFIKKDAPFRHTLSQLADSLHIRMELVEVSHYSSEELLHLVSTGEIDYTITDENIARALSYSLKNIDYSVALSSGITVSWAIPQSADLLLKEINEWLEVIQKEGTFRFLYNRYFNNTHSISRNRSNYALIRQGDISPFDRELKQYNSLLEWDWRLLAAIVYTESRFDPEAESQVGAYGLMQVIPETADMFHVLDYFQPDSNIYVGVRYLKYLEEVFKKYPIEPEERTKFILASYNVGAGHVMDAMRLASKYGKDPYIWNDHVAYYLRHKSDPRYYRDPVVRNGYCDGQQAYNYVNRVLETYNSYRHIEQTPDSRS